MQRRTRNLARTLVLGLLPLAAACADQPAAPTAAPAQPRASLAGLAWTGGLPTGTGGSVAPAALRDLPGGLVGTSFWKSNNPESFRGEGLLMTSGSQASRRGGSARSLTGSATLYLSHLNKGTQGYYVHLLASNPTATTVTLTGKGSMRTNANWRHLTADTAVKSAWYLSSDDWIRNRLSNVNISVPSLKARQIARIWMPSTSPVHSMEGRYEVNIAGGSLYFHAVVTANGDSLRAINYASGVTGYQVDAPGDYLYTDANGYNAAGDLAFGREAGIATHSAWYTGDVNLSLPSATSHMGLAFNTNNLYAATDGSRLQEQTAAHSLLRLNSSLRTWGGYGHKYNVKLVLTNPNTSARNVRVALASNPISGTQPQLTFDAPVALVDPAANDTIFKAVWLKPAAPRLSIGTFSVPANTTVTRNVIVYIPGLGSSGQQLIIESGV